MTDEGSLRVTNTECGIGVLQQQNDFFALALGPHPQRELTPTPSRGGAWPRLSVAAGAFALALGPHPQRELTLMPRLGFACPRLGMAAGARETS